MATIQISNTPVSQLEALWSFYQSQSARVQKAFLKRAVAQSKAADNDADMRAADAAMPAEQRDALHRMASEVNRRAQEVERAVRQGKRAGRSAEDFLAELRKGRE